MDKENVVIYTMKYYTTEKNNNILNFVKKWVELGNIILSEVTQTQKDNYHMYSLIGCFKHKVKKAILQTTIPENLENNEDPKRNIHGSNLNNLI